MPNAMLATKISFMNDIANLCEKMGADVNWVRKGIGSDPELAQFIYRYWVWRLLFPQRCKSFVRTGRENGHTMRILEAVEAVNDDQKSVCSIKSTPTSAATFRARLLLSGDCHLSRIRTTCARRRPSY